MQLETPYKTPSTMDAAVEEVGTYSPKIFSNNGRIGRIRYLAYSMLYQLILSIVFALVSALFAPLAMGWFGDIPLLVGAVIALAVIITVWVMVVPMRRRLHDMNCSGWWSIFGFIPLINFIFGLVLLVVPGNKDKNRFGEKPEKNSILVVIVGLILPLLIIGLSAAIAIPVYKNYVERVQQLQS
ncbi:DUF805 domain-containing protein [Zooshikella sp. RANM57]|uniref:DUF805 domain-containing protein n=1 Tax=Zooshikella sp. RANM57 TaxID=3425863 RepID=UPI003D6DDE45